MFKTASSGIILKVPKISTSMFKSSLIMLLLTLGFASFIAVDGDTGINYYELNSGKSLTEQPFHGHGGEQLKIAVSAGLTEEIMNSENVNSLYLNVRYYDLYFEVDPANDHFRSVQNITIFTRSLSDTISFYLHSDLVINDVKIWDNETSEVRIDNWKMDYEDLIDGTVGMKFAKVEINLHNFITFSSEYYIHIDYSIQPEAIADDVGEELCRFTVSKKGTRGLGWLSGLVPMFTNGNDYAAPHSIEIKHPSDESCIATGKRVSTVEDGDYSIVKYISNRSTAPSFSVAAYKIMKMTQNNITVEFFYFEGEAISEGIINTLIQGINLFTDYLGDTGDRNYQFGFVEVDDSLTGGTSRGDTIFMRTGRYKNLDTDLRDQVLMITFLFHEIAHNWNGFVQGSTWSGNDYFLWYQEGGANFLATWACERIMGAEAANLYRKFNLERYDRFKGYDSKYNLRTIPNIFLSELSDIAVAYEYGGIVWEQLLLKLGEESLFKGLSDFTKDYWINDERNGMVTIYDLFEAFDKFTQIDVESYLDQWGIRNSIIELMISDTHSEKRDSSYQTTVEVNMVADWDYEIFTSLGYKTDTGMNLIDVHFTESGKHVIKFTSEQEPESIEIDPEYRVPRKGVYDPPSDSPIPGLILLTGVVILGYTIIKRRKVSFRKQSNSE